MERIVEISGALDDGASSEERTKPQWRQTVGKVEPTGQGGKVDMIEYEVVPPSWLTTVPGTEEVGTNWGGGGQSGNLAFGNGIISFDDSFDEVGLDASPQRGFEGCRQVEEPL